MPEGRAVGRGVKAALKPALAQVDELWMDGWMDAQAALKKAAWGLHKCHARMEPDETAASVLAGAAAQQEPAPH